jgi:hypothetical protein
VHANAADPISSNQVARREQLEGIRWANGTYAR